MKKSNGKEVKFKYAIQDREYIIKLQGLTTGNLVSINYKGRYIADYQIIKVTSPYEFFEASDDYSRSLLLFTQEMINEWDQTKRPEFVFDE
jgi:hypothetical protein